MTKPFVLIALTGLAGSGKDTVADLLVTHAGFYKLAFADALRNEVCNAFGIEPLHLSHRDTKEHPMTTLALSKCLDTAFADRMIVGHQQSGNPINPNAPRSPRQIMQWWGTDYRRQQDPNYWTQQLASRINYRARAGLDHRFVITDCRFENEAQLVRDFGGLIWQVNRPGLVAPVSAHVSEVTGEAFAPDAAIDNSADLKTNMRHLQQQVLGAFWAHDAGLASVKVEIAA